MKAGYFKICIDPPYGAPIVGYYEKRLTKGILDSLFARAAAFDDGERRAVIITLDVCVLPKQYFNRLITTVAEAVSIPEAAVFVNLSHTHTGPLVGKDFASDTKSSAAYDEFLITSARDAAIYAFADLREAVFETAEAEANGISFVRRYLMKDGYVATNPGVKNPNIAKPLGTPNETVKLIKILRDGGDDIFMVNFGTHPDSVGGEYISADYIGYVCDTVEKALPGTSCMFLQGFQGDVNHVNVAPADAESAISEIDFDGVPRSIRHAEHMGRVIAGAVISVCSIASPVNADKLAFAAMNINLPSNKENHKLPEARRICELYDSGRASELPYKEMELTTAVAQARRIVSLENGPDHFEFGVFAISLGDIAFAGIGGEPFVELGRRISAASPFKTTVLCGLTNGSDGYIPTSQAYSEGGYEVKGSTLKEGGDNIAVEAVNILLSKLKKG